MTTIVLCKNGFKQARSCENGQDADGCSGGAADDDSDEDWGEWKASPWLDEFGWDGHDEAMMAYKEAYYETESEFERWDEEEEEEKDEEDDDGVDDDVVEVDGVDDGGVAVGVDDSDEEEVKVDGVDDYDEEDVEVEVDEEEAQTDAGMNENDDDDDDDDDDGATISVELVNTDEEKSQAARVAEFFALSGDGDVLDAVCDRLDTAFARRPDVCPIFMTHRVQKHTASKTKLHTKKHDDKGRLKKRGTSSRGGVFLFKGITSQWLAYLASQTRYHNWPPQMASIQLASLNS
jgi:hypothetical protein